ncbi:MAG: YqaE/Pmp3 family membrane protein [Lacibacter sp.]|nr:YqaE/Pmp3 family membrane protein [Lacibacter sp.]
MRKIIIAFLAVVFSVTSYAGIIYVPANASDNAKAGVEATIAKVKASNMDAFLSLTPEKVKEMTGKKMSFGQKIALKMAQKKAKRAGGEIPKGLYIVLAIFGLAWVAMGIMDDWSGSTWIINLVLTLLFWLPGLIHALIVMKNYY